MASAGAGTVIKVDGVVQSNVNFVGGDPQAQINNKSSVIVNNAKEDVNFTSDPQTQITTLNELITAAQDTANNKSSVNVNNVKTDINFTSDPQTQINTQQQATNTHFADNVKHITSGERSDWNGHISNGEVHVTNNDKANWNGKSNNDLTNVQTIHKNFSGDYQVTTGGIAVTNFNLPNNTGQIGRAYTLQYQSISWSPIPSPGYSAFYENSISFTHESLPFKFVNLSVAGKSCYVTINSVTPTQINITTTCEVTGDACKNTFYSGFISDIYSYSAPIIDDILSMGSVLPTFTETFNKRPRIANVGGETNINSVISLSAIVNATSGGRKYSDGLIINWGTTTTASTSVTFQVPYTQYSRVVFSSIVNFTTAPTTTGFAINDLAYGVNYKPSRVDWVAIGY